MTHSPWREDRKKREERYLVPFFSLQMIAAKRKLAEEEAKNVSSAEQVAQVLRGRAAGSRNFADKIRQI